MIIEIPNGGVVDVTTLLGATETNRIALESNFDTERTVYLTLSDTEPSSTDDCEATLQPNRESPFCQRSITGVTGSKVYAMITHSADNSPVKLRASVG